MREKNIYQCDESCRECTYEFKNPTGYDFLDECITDKCPHGHEQTGNIDRIMGRHSDGYGWNPLGEFCNICKHDSCEDCIKWSNRDKKLRNNIPTELRPKRVTEKPVEQENIHETETRIKTNVETLVIEKPRDIFDDDDDFAPLTTNVSDKEALISNETGNERPENVVDDDIKTDKTNAPSVYDADKIETIDGDDDNEAIENEEIVNADDIIEDEEDKEANTTQEFVFTETPADEVVSDDDPMFEDEINGNNTNNDIEEDDGDDDFDGEYDEGEDIDFGFDDNDQEYSGEVNFDDYQSEFDLEDDEEIPAPDECDEEYNDTDDEDDDIDDEDYDEDEDAEFGLFFPTKQLKASLLFPIDEKIALYRVNRKGVYLTVKGNVKITVRGRDDSDGFSYYDAKRFPRYIIEKVMDGSIYKDRNLKVDDETFYNFMYFEEIDGEIIEKKNVKCGYDLSKATEERLRKYMKLMFDEYPEN